MSSVRGELLVPTVRTNGATPSEGGNSPPPQPKTFLRRLGIRKPSLMSLTSPLQTGRTARTFSLDDLLRPQVPSKVSRPIMPFPIKPSPSPTRTQKPFSHRICIYTLHHLINNKLLLQNTSLLLFCLSWHLTWTCSFYTTYLYT